MAPNSDAEDYLDMDDMEEVEVDDDVPPFDDDDDIIGDMDDNIELIDDNIADESKVIFQPHTASVFSIDVSTNPSVRLAVSGGEDDRAYVWNYETGQCLFECTGHTDSVVSCGFSTDMGFVMSADMAGNVRVFKIPAAGDTTEMGQLVWDFQCGDMEWCQWHPSARGVLFGGTNDGDVYMWKVPNGDGCKIFAGHGSRTTCGKVCGSGTEMVVGYGDGSVKKWDLKATSSLFHYKPPPVDDTDEPQSVLCVDLLDSSNLVAIGTEKGHVTFLNSNTGKQICTFTVNTTNNNPITEMEEEDAGESIAAVESVAFSPCGCFLAAGSVNATLSVWDISLQRIRHTLTGPAGVTKVLWNGGSVVSACLDGVVRCWDHRSGELVREVTGNGGNILDMVVTQDGRYLLTAGDDCTARVFEM